MKITRKNVYCIGTIVMAILWPLLFVGTVSYESTFLFIGIVSAVCAFFRKDKEGKKIHNICYGCIAVMMSFALIVADYSIFIGHGIIGFMKMPIAFAVGTYLIYNIEANAAGMIFRFDLRKETSSKNKKIVLLSAFAIPTVIDILYLYLCAFPGWVSSDIATQIGQMVIGEYSNHHPYWHTKMMEMIILPILNRTGNGNAAVAAFCIFQIIIMSAVFAYSIDTLLEIKLNIKLVIAIVALYSIMPYNVGMSCALTKDTAFAIAVSLFITASYRCLYGIGKNKWINNILVFIGGCGACLLRTNGKFAFIVVMIALLVLLDKKKNVCYISLCAGALVVSFLLGTVYLSVLNITQPDTVESLSIPLQQIARCSEDQKVIEGNELEFINSFTDYAGMAERYNPSCSDNIKNYIRAEGDQAYLSEHKVDFIKVWLKVGIKYPFNYIKAWADETRGFWSGSYYYSIWHRGITDGLDMSFYNIVNVEHNALALKIWEWWEGIIAYNSIPFLEIIMSVGIRFWSLIFLFVWAILNNRKASVLLVFPIALIATLAIATPVCVEFRYAYAVFTSYAICVLAVITDNYKSIE